MNTSNVPLLGQNQPENETPQQQRSALTTAFVIWIDPEGRVGASAAPELLADEVLITRPASADDMYGACSNVMRQLTTQFAALETHSVMMSQARAAAEAAQNARISEMVANSRVN